MLGTFRDESTDDGIVIYTDAQNSDTVTITATQGVQPTSIFDTGNNTSVFDFFKTLIQYKYLENFTAYCVRLVKLVELGKFDKGAISSAGRYNSMHGRWFSKKTMVKIKML